MRTAIGCMFGVLALSAACDRDRPQPPPAEHVLVATPDSILAITTANEERIEGDSLRAIVDSLDRALAVAKDEERPALLLALGRAIMNFSWHMYVGYRHSDLAEANPHAFDAGHEQWIYNGWHFEQLIAQYPQHELADDAGFEMTKLDAIGDCDGYVDCNIDFRWRFVRPFLEQFPASPLVPLALEAMLQTFEEELRDENITSPVEGFVPHLVREQLSGLDSVVSKLPPQYREEAERRSAKLWQVLGR